MRKLALVAIVVSIASCTNEEVIQPPTPDFGPWAYRWLVDSLQPVIINDTLVAMIGYSGCETLKVPLELQYRIENSECSLWLHNPSHYWETCLAYFSQTVRMRVPSEVARSSTIVLLGSNQRYNLSR